MTEYARIEAGMVVEKFSPPEGVLIATCFVPSLIWVACGPEVLQGWTYDGTTFAAPVPVPPPEPTSDQILAEKIAAGIGVTSTGNPGLNAVYALDDVSTGQIFQIGLFANQFGVFPSGATTQPYPDLTGVPHVFTVAQFIAFLRAVAPLVSALTTQAAIMAHGGPPNWPVQTATIV